MTNNEPKISLEIASQISVVPFGKEEGMFRVPENDIILKRERNFDVIAVGALKSEEVAPLTKEQIEWVHANGLGSNPRKLRMILNSK